MTSRSTVLHQYLEFDDKMTRPGDTSAAPTTDRPPVSETPLSIPLHPLPEDDIRTPLSPTSTLGVNMETDRDQRMPGDGQMWTWRHERTSSHDSEPLLKYGADNLSFDFALQGELAFSHKLKSRRRPWIICGMVSGITLLGILLVLNILLYVSRQTWADDYDPDNIFAGWGQPGTGTAGLAWYPTDFLRDVIPKPIHSHNDYWRKVPLFSALYVGSIGVEADVWWFDDDERRDDLYVGHDTAALQPNRTFQSLYIQPLVDILERQNPDTQFYNDTRRGVFDRNPDQTLTLLVDVKTDGATTWPKVVEQLEPLRSRGWLSSFNNGDVRVGPITVVGTGDTPFDQVVQNSTYRDVFFDAPLDRLSESEFDWTNSYYASVSFKSTIGEAWMGRLSKNQIRKIKRQVRRAHQRGLKARYWDLPEWPISVRNHIWEILAREEVDLLNVDDLKGAAKKDWSRFAPL